MFLLTRFISVFSIDDTEIEPTSLWCLVLLIC